MNSNVIHDLQDWYLAQCDDDWEHQFGIKIDTLDNPGWSISINLEDTMLEACSFQETKWNTDELDWGHCKIVDRVFKGYGGPKNLHDLISVFRQWVENLEKL